MIELKMQDEGTSVVNFCHQMAAWVPAMFYNFYLVKSHKIDNNTAMLDKNKHLFFNP
jgi:hypothetical protein